MGLSQRGIFERPQQVVNVVGAGIATHLDDDASKLNLSMRCVWND
jgi:hypothetical protein